jgi:rRNA-processing protein FCF1
MIPGKFKVDVFAELDKLGFSPVVLTCVLGEINKIASSGGKAGSQAKVALAILDIRKPHMIAARGPTDRALLGRATESGCAIATNDAALISKARKNGITVLRLRQKKYVVEE